MILTAVYSQKNGRSCLLHYIDRYQQYAAFTYQKFPRFKPQFQFSSIFLTEILKGLSYFFTDLFNWCNEITFLVCHFESGAEIHELQFGKIACCLIEQFCSLQKHICIYNITSGMHMQTYDMQFVVFHNALNVSQLVDRNSEFRIDVTH
ncbi:hypothetical protein D3C80_984510 [compost metagenome]